MTSEDFCAHGGHSDDAAFEVLPRVREEVVRAAWPRPAPRCRLPPRHALRRVRPSPAAAATSVSSHVPSSRATLTCRASIHGRTSQREHIQVVQNVCKE